MKCRYGCAHGRFQPFHNGHLEYVMAAASRCEFLFVGITEYQLALDDDSSPQHRLSALDNPFTYWQRAIIIRSALENAGLPSSRFQITPFPIHDLSLADFYVPRDAIMFTTVYDEWNERKINRLEDAGFKTAVLWRRETKLYEGKEVRSALRENRPEFVSLVPAGTTKIIKEFFEALR